MQFFYDSGNITYDVSGLFCQCLRIFLQAFFSARRFLA